MNIFVTDLCPVKSAQEQCDKHVVKNGPRVCPDVIYGLARIFFRIRRRTRTI